MCSSFLWPPVVCLGEEDSQMLAPLTNPETGGPTAAFTDAGKTPSDFPEVTQGSPVEPGY